MCVSSNKNKKETINFGCNDPIEIYIKNYEQRQCIIIAYEIDINYFVRIVKCKFDIFMWNLHQKPKWLRIKMFDGWV